MGEYVCRSEAFIIDSHDLIDKSESAIKRQSELNEMQQKLLDDLKHVYSWQHSNAWSLFYYLVDGNTKIFDEETINNFMTMSEEDSLAVQIIFSQWVLLQKEEKKSRNTDGFEKLSL